MKIHLYSNEQRKKKYPNYTIRKTSELEKKYLYSKEWFNKKRRKQKIVTKTYTLLMTLKDIETKDFRM